MTPILSITDTPLHIIEAQEAYDAVKASYDRALSLRQAKLASEIEPALRSAKSRLLAAEVRHG